MVCFRSRWEGLTDGSFGESVCVCDLLGLKGLLPVLDQLLIISMSEEREEAAVTCLSEG